MTSSPSVEPVPPVEQAPRIETERRNAAEAAVAEVKDGMMLGLGSGNTVGYAIAALGRRVAEGLNIRAVATSQRTAALAASLNIGIVDFGTMTHVDLCIDGVDEIDPAFRAIKGAGGALLREKIVAAAATRMIAIADRAKSVVQLGIAAVPAEVLPFAQGFVEDCVRALRGVPIRRADARGTPWLSDQHNIILDCRFGLIADPERLAASLSAIPGLLGHGVFVSEIDTLYIGDAVGAVRSDRPDRPNPRKVHHAL